MAVAEYSKAIISISLLDYLKIHYLSFLWGLWSLLKRFIKNIFFHSKGCDLLCDRGKPPACLVDTSLGQHSYVKLKVCI